jgi:hypothetical protein
VAVALRPGSQRQQEALGGLPPRGHPPVARHLSSRYCRALQTARMLCRQRGAVGAAHLRRRHHEVAQPHRPTASPNRIAQPHRPTASPKCGPCAARVRHSGKTIMLFAHQGIFFAATGLTCKRAGRSCSNPANSSGSSRALRRATGKRSAGRVKRERIFRAAALN